MVICKGKDCKKSASYNYENFTGKALYCKDHKLEDMINVKNKICKIKDCKTRASFGNKIKIYCEKHKEEGMINLNHDLCKEKDCKTRPTFNFSGNKKGLYCKKHRLEGMVDTINKKCKEENCFKIPNYNYSDKKSGLYCSNHKKENMVSILYVCKKNMCFLYPCYNYSGEKIGLYCNKHKSDGMINVRDNTCKSEFCKMSHNIKYDYFCTHCFANLFPDDPRTLLIRKKSKEIKVVSYITNKIEGFYHDKPLYVDLKGGCCNSKRRIDLRKLIGSTLLCIEIDENQHKYYNKQDQLDRYDNLFMDFSGKYVFIRYNPDKYKIKEKSFNPRFETRMEKLEEEINKQIKRIENDKNEELVEIIKLFFDSST